ncbi:MAG TPA: hypothetical protein VFC78_14815 [Tepidisphaeraceae bacterium]|nr:hypothetical protein [Tepidisphaeraceae bacterium]
MYNRLMYILLIACAAILAVELVNPRRAPAPPLVRKASRPVDLDRRLDAPIREVNFHATPLKTVLQELASQAGVNLIPNWVQLTDFKFVPALPVTVHLRGLSLRSALAAISATICLTPDTRMAAYVDHGGIIVVSVEWDGRINIRHLPNNFLSVGDLVPEGVEKPLTWRLRHQTFDVPFGAGADTWELCNALNTAVAPLECRPFAKALSCSAYSYELRAAQQILNGMRRPRTIIGDEDPAIAQEPILHRRMANFQLNAVPSMQAIQAWADAVGANVVLGVVPNGEGSGPGSRILKNEPITLRLKDVSVEDALVQVNDALGHVSPKLPYWEDDGVLYVGSLASIGIPRVYDVRPALRVAATQPAFENKQELRPSYDPMIKVGDGLVERLGAWLGEQSYVKVSPSGEMIPARLQYWRGRLVATGPASFHRRVRYYLRTLARTGNEPTGEAPPQNPDPQ